MGVFDRLLVSIPSGIGVTTENPHRRTDLSIDNINDADAITAELVNTNRPLKKSKVYCGSFRMKVPSGDPDYVAKIRKVYSTYRKVELRTWSDQKFLRLSQLPASGQSLWLYLLTGPYTRGIPGLVRSGRMAMAEALGWQQDEFDACIAEIVAQKMSIIDWDAQLIWLPNAIQHNSPTSPNIVKSWRLQWELIPDCELKITIFDTLHDAVHLLGPVYGQAFDATMTRPKSDFGTPSGRAFGSDFGSDSGTPSARACRIQRAESKPKTLNQPKTQPTQNQGQKLLTPTSQTRIGQVNLPDNAHAKRAQKSSKKVAKAAEIVGTESIEALQDKAYSDLTPSRTASGSDSGSDFGSDSGTPSSEGSSTAGQKPLLGMDDDLESKQIAKALAKPSTKAIALAKAASDTAETWLAYSAAYARRYSVEPIRNATVNSQMALFVKRVGMVEAPHIAGYFLSNSSRYYTAHVHPVGALLADAEKLRTEWATQHQITANEANAIDRTQTNLNAFGPMLREARAREEAEEAARMFPAQGGSHGK